MVGTLRDDWEAKPDRRLRDLAPRTTYFPLRSLINIVAHPPTEGGASSHQRLFLLDGRMALDQ